MAMAASPKEMVWVEGADHFFVGKLDQVQRAIRNWCEAHFLLSVVQ
jgi:alpha/beta superfamily hydrolase